MMPIDSKRFIAPVMTFLAVIGLGAYGAVKCAADTDAEMCGDFESFCYHFWAISRLGDSSIMLLGAEATALSGVVYGLQNWLIDHRPNFTDGPSLSQRLAGCNAFFRCGPCKEVDPAEGMGDGLLTVLVDKKSSLQHLGTITMDCYGSVNAAPSR